MRTYLFFLLCLIAYSNALKAQTVTIRPTRWAQPLLDIRLENAFALDQKVYRSAQPEEEGFEDLAIAGFTDVLSLRQYHSDKDDVGDAKLTLHRVSMNAGKILDQDIISALKILIDTEGKVLIHCWHGSDRTGVVSAMYRIIVQKWSRQDALDEFLKGGFGYHSVFENIPEYIRSVDLEKIRNGVFEAK